MTLAPSTGSAARTHLVDRLGDPSVAASLEVLLDHADLLAILVEGLDGFVARSEVIGDSLVSGLDDLRGVTGDGGGLDGAAAELGRLKDAAASLMQSDLLKPEALEQLGVLSRGLARGGERYAATPVEITGVRSMARLLKDPDIKRALGYVATLAQAIGQELDQPSPRTEKL